MPAVFGLVACVSTIPTRKPRRACSWSQDGGRMVPRHQARPPPLNPAEPGPAKPSPPAALWECTTEVLGEPPVVQVACHVAFVAVAD